MKIIARQMGAMMNRAVVALMNGRHGGMVISHRPGIGVNYTLSRIAEEYFGMPPAIIDLDGDFSVGELARILYNHRANRMVMILVNRETFACPAIVSLLKTACERQEINYHSPAASLIFDFSSLIVFVNNSPDTKPMPAPIIDRCLQLHIQ